MCVYAACQTWARFVEKAAQNTVINYKMQTNAECVYETMQFAHITSERQRNSLLRMALKFDALLKDKIVQASKSSLPSINGIGVYAFTTTCMNIIHHAKSVRMCVLGRDKWDGCAPFDCACTITCVVAPL